MIAPKSGTNLMSKLYNNLFQVEIESKNDGSKFQGVFGSTKKQRILSASNIDGEASEFSFTPKITIHGS